MADHLCTQKGCGNKSLARGLCDNHYKIAERAGTLPPRRRWATNYRCRIKDCPESQYAKHLCKKHYEDIRAPVEECIVVGCGAAVAHHKSNRCIRHIRVKQRERATAGGQRKLIPPGMSSLPFDESAFDARMSVFGYRCAYCGGPFEELDHLKPIAAGGQHILANYRPACVRCNRAKHDKDAKEWLHTVKTGAIGLCSFDGCTRRSHACGLCTGHYQRKKFGTPMDRPWNAGAWARHGAEPQDARTRFMALVDKTESCWLWKGSIKAGSGYGEFSMKRANGKWGARSAHIVAYELFIGPIPNGQDVCHSCDIRSCVNYEKHLFLGTRSENMLDARKKGRHPTAKLTADQVSSIRTRYAQGNTTHAALAKEHGVCVATVSHILTGRNWKTA